MQPKVLLTNVEYIALKMQAHPGQSGRFYRRALSGYKYGPEFDPKGEGQGMYFLKAPPYRTEGYRYPGNLWEDCAASTVRKNVSWYPKDRPHTLKPARSEWHLTRKGWDKANAARKKLGLEPIPYNADPTDGIEWLDVVPN